LRKTDIKLFIYEIRKMIFSGYGWLLFLGLLVLKCLTLFLIPEAIDERILLSRKQYDKYLLEIHGEDSSEKRTRILADYAECKMLEDAQLEMEDAYRKGTISEEEWNEYLERYRIMQLRKNALQIFSEKAEQFQSTPEDVRPAAYFDEYGWKTVFLVQKYPDLFIVVYLIILSVRSFSIETQSGMREIILASAKGRVTLFRAKTATLFLILIISGILFACGEWTVFSLRGFLAEGQYPIYSLSLYAEGCYLPLTLYQAFLLCSIYRLTGAVLLGLTVMALSVWIRRPGNTLTAAIIFIAVSYVILILFNCTGVYIHTGQLCPGRCLYYLWEQGVNLAVPLIVTIILTLTIIVCSRYHYSTE
jgi:hypothetical protein